MCFFLLLMLSMSDQLRQSHTSFHVKRLLLIFGWYTNKFSYGIRFCFFLLLPLFPSFFIRSILYLKARKESPKIDGLFGIISIMVRVEFDRFHILIDSKQLQLICGFLEEDKKIRANGGIRVTIE